MSRITRRFQYERHHHIVEIRQAWPLAIARLDPLMQLDLNWFYEPQHEHTVSSLRAYPKAEAKRSPSLPQRAGKAYAELLRILPLEQNRHLLPAHKKGAQTTVRVFGDPRPDISVTAMAEILLDMMREDLARQRSEREDSEAA